MPAVELLLGLALGTMNAADAAARFREHVVATGRASLFMSTATT